MQSDEIEDSLWLLSNKNKKESKKKTKSRSNSRKGQRVQVDDNFHPKINNFVDASSQASKNWQVIGSGKINSSYSKNSGISQSKQNFVSSKMNISMSSQSKGQKNSR